MVDQGLLEEGEAGRVRFDDGWVRVEGGGEVRDGDAVDLAQSGEVGGVRAVLGGG